MTILKGLLATAGLATALIGTPVMASDDACQLTIESNDQLQFDRDSLSVPASCDSVSLTLEHTGSMPADAMGHNWVLAATADAQALAMDGMRAGPDADYLPEGDDRVIAATEIIGGGESTRITFDTAGLAGRDLTFFCSFPGHFASMQGSFRVQE
ncbi:azurin [Halomonas sp. 18H]|uniref:azurin n=1 Tax=Halomonas almeriensis TaxID=308163 RepID=UPI0022304DDE|nr:MULTISPECIES: azurin [Halomonas]MCW4151564.1 azurin [Halomonas sp. 18H]MDN3552701.1 azurin [Halomonas almeriensis]